MANKTSDKSFFLDYWQLLMVEPRCEGGVGISSTHSNDQVNIYISKRYI
jgi:hypothetical protein